MGEKIKNRFLYYKYKANFKNDLALQNINAEQIVFIEDTKEVWTHGTYFADGSGSPNLPAQNLKWE